VLEHAIETGRGGVYLRLTPEQFAAETALDQQPDLFIVAP
jgi:hypothetical protein